MDEEMEKKIKKNLSLIGEKEKTGDWSKLINAHQNIWGHADNIRGNVTNIGGDVTSISGNVSNIKGDVTSICGNVTDIWGDVTGIGGYVTDIIKILNKD